LKHISLFKKLQILQEPILILPSKNDYLYYIDHLPVILNTWKDCLKAWRKIYGYIEGDTQQYDKKLGSWNQTDLVTATRYTSMETFLYQKGLTIINS